MGTITSEELKQLLKPHNRFLGHRPGNTLAFLDPVFELLPDDDAEIMSLCGQASQEVVDWFKSKDHRNCAGLTKETLYLIYKKSVSDCEDITAWSIAFFQMLWRVAGHQHNATLFRCVIDQDPVNHSVGWGVTESRRVFLFEFQNLTFLPEHRILAVT